VAVCHGLKARSHRDSSAKWRAVAVRLTAPFEGNGDLFVRALNLSKARRSADEYQLGQFKRVGLSEVELLQDAFEPLAHYQPATPRANDVLVLSI
jgi:hypothetical protein